MATFAEDIEQAAEGELIEAVVIGNFGWSGYGAPEGRIQPRRNVVLSWDEARPALNYVYDRGYGAPDCDAVWVWTRSRVLFVGEYDGSTGMESVPRHPAPGTPEHI